MFIYLIQNIINLKVYVGQTIHPIEQRFHRHITDAMNNVLDTHFARAIRKYGPENFVLYLWDTATSQEELTAKEYYWIHYFNSAIYGYNSTDAEYKCGGNTYKHKTPEEMEDIKAKLRESKIGRNNPRATMIKCLNVNTMYEYFFNSLEDCRVFLGAPNHRCLSARIRHEIRSLYNGEWAIAYYYGDYEYDEPGTGGKGSNGKKVSVFYWRTFEEKVFNSMRQACKEYGWNEHLLNGKKGRIFIGEYRVDIY